jgi:dynein heavy chain 2
MTQVDRILAKPGGSLLVAGRAGVGRQTAVAVVANMHNMAFMSPEVTRDYTRKRFFVTLKRCYEEAALGERETVLFIEDYHIEFDFVLECVNSILSSGDVPGLYPPEELAPLMDRIKQVMEETGAFGVAPYDFFISRVVKRLHVVLSMDPTNELFNKRCQSNPALFNVCNIVWMGAWRKQSMLEVPRLLLPVLIGEEDEHGLAQLSVDIHTSCATVGKDNSVFDSDALTATPRNFVSFLLMHQKLYNEKKDNLINNANRMEGGLSKLKEAAVTVDELTTNAIAKRKVLAQKQKLADEAMVNITAALEGATERRQSVEDLTKAIAEKTEVLTVQKAEIEKELSEVKPLLEEAAKAVSGVSAKDLGEIKSLKTPPEPIRDVLSGVLTLLGIQDTSWNSMKAFLGKRGVIESIINFDAHAVSAKVRSATSKILKEKERSFEPKVIFKVSQAAAPLASWVSATVRFSTVLEHVEPLTQKLNEATAFLSESQGKLDANQAELDVIDKKVSRLKVEFAQLMAEAEQLRVDLQKTEETLDKAQNLLGKLDGERSRWEVTAAELRDAVKTLPVKIMMAAAYTTYLGKSSEDVRAKAVGIWRTYTKTKSFDYRAMMSTESELLEFKARGLPADILSMENSLVILNSESRCPFIIDPASSATAWLTNQLALDDGRPLEVVPAADPRFQNKTELAVRFGKTLVILEVDSVEPMLVPLVKRDFTNQGSRRVVKLGDKQVDFNMQFRMYVRVWRNTWVSCLCFLQAFAANAGVRSRQH